MKNYYSLSKKDREATVQIYGDITSYPLLESDVSSFALSKQISDLDVDTISVYINSYGGEVAEGWAIYNALQKHPAKIHTYVDGFACSIASVIFMAGDIRSMHEVSLLMVHNPWCSVAGNSDELRKCAESLDTMGELSAKAYTRHVTISEDELQKMLDNESWIGSEQAVLMGFATDIIKSSGASVAQQSARGAVIQRILSQSTPVAESAPLVDKVKEESNKTMKFLEALIAPEGESK